MMTRRQVVGTRGTWYVTGSIGSDTTLHYCTDPEVDGGVVTATFYELKPGFRRATGVGRIGFYAHAYNPRGGP